MKKDNFLLHYKKIIYFLFFLILIIFLISYLERQRIVGESMSPTLTSGQQVTVSYIPWQSFNRGDIVVVSFATLNNYEIKRLVALPKEIISFNSSGTLLINGKVYSSSGTFVPFSSSSSGILLKQLQFYNNTIPSNMYLVLGDNMKISADSRMYGLISREQLKGKLLFIS